MTGDLRGAWVGLTGVLVVVGVVLVTASTVDEAGTDVLVLSALTVAVAASTWALAPVRRGRWPQVWSSMALVHLLLVGAVAPATAALTVSLVIVVFVYVGVTATPRVAATLVPLAAVVVFAALPTEQVVVRGALQLVLVVLVSQLPSRLLATLAERRAELAREHDQVVRAERVMGSAMERFRRVFDDSPVGMSLSDEHGRVVEANDACVAMIGRPRDAIIGSGADLWTLPEDVAQYDGLAERMDQAAGGVVDLEVRFARADGAVRWVWLTLAPIEGPLQQRWTLAHAVDVTARREAEDRAVRAHRVSRSLADIARLAQRGADPRSGIVEAFAELTRADAVAVVEPVDRDELVVTRAIGAQTEGVRVDLRVLSMTAEVWRTGRVVDIPDLSNEAMVNPALAQLVGARAGIWQPVTVDGQVVAVLIGTWTDARPFTPEQVRAEVAMLAAEAGAALRADQLRHELETISVTDSLTGLANRRGWDLQVDAVLQQSARAGRPAVVAMIDLDGFKSFNDAHGHQRGDEVLVAFAQVLRTQLRREDLVSRWGGDEFALAMPGCDLAEAERVLERVRRASPPHARSSIGLVEHRPGGEDLAQLVRRADQALYAAKAAGRDTVVIG